MRLLASILCVPIIAFGVELDRPIPPNPEFDTIQLDTTWSNGVSEGRLQWNIDDGTMEYGMAGGNVNLQVGLEMLMRVTNKTGATISNGVPVYINGAQGSRPTIDKADSDDPDKHHVVGVTTEDIDNNSSGYICTYGYVRDIDTSAWTAGNDLYLSTTAGVLTNGMPSHPADVMHVGTVLFSNAESGIIAVNPTHEKEISPYGALYIHDGSFTNSLSVSDQYYQLENFTQGLSYQATLTASNITINADGIYDVQQFISFSGVSAGDGNKTYESAIHINGAHQNPGEFRRKLGAGADVGSASSGGLFSLSAGDVIDLRMKCVGTTGNIVIEQLSFFVERIH